MEWSQEDGYLSSVVLHDRILAGNESSLYDDKDAGYYEKSIVPIDYTVFSIGIATLYLVLVVEFVRHSIDISARGRPFFKAVLSMAYSECK